MIFQTCHISLCGLRAWWLASLFAAFYCFTLSGQCVDAVVAPDGTGDFRTIQEAIQAAPTGNQKGHRILIREGVYEEKLFFEKSGITLIGEHRDSTIITSAVLRRHWREEHPDDWGAATVNIRQGVTDLTFANLTIRNDFADKYPDDPDPHDHSFAIRGGGHRIKIIYCNVISTGGDTHSLWNTEGGMFYHSHCYFEGYVDYVAPRGYCYITDSEFFGHNSTASIWHDGSGGKDQKLVIRRSRLDGDPGTALGRYHRDAAFYLVDCYLGEGLSTAQGIYHTGSEPLQWGERVYYHNTHRDLIDFRWHKDNLDLAEGQPEPEDITAAWTFGDQWDPEGELAGVMPFAILPVPADGEGCVPVGIELSWVPARCALSHQVWAGTEPDSLIWLTETSDPRLVMTDLVPGRTYYWRVDEVLDHETSPGPIWCFTTASADGKPLQVQGPEPMNGADYQSNIPRINWTYDGCSADSFDVFLGLAADQLDKVKTVKYPGHLINQAQDNTRYFWRIDAKNARGVTKGPVWTFIYNSSLTAVNKAVTEADRFWIRAEGAMPVRHVLRVKYHLPVAGEVHLECINLSGQKVAGWHQSSLSMGTYDMQFFTNQPNLVPGIYWCTLRWNGILQAKVKVLVAP